jgi:hypothetical protein
MDLFHVKELSGAEGVFDNGKIRSDMTGKVSHIVTGIQAVIGRMAHAPMPGKHSMYKLWITGKKGVAEIWNRLFDPYQAGSVRRGVH